MSEGLVESAARAMQGLNAIRMLRDRQWESCTQDERDHWTRLAEAAAIVFKAEFSIGFNIGREAAAKVAETYQQWVPGPTYARDYPHILIMQRIRALTPPDGEPPA